MPKKKTKKKPRKIRKTRVTNKPGLSLNTLKAMYDNDTLAIADNMRAILKELGEDVKREGLEDTPIRVAKMYKELFSSLHSEPPQLTVFENQRKKYDEMVCEADIHFNSMCEHHLLPFVGKVHIAYLPKAKVVGLSKLARVVDYFSHKP